MLNPLWLHRIAHGLHNGHVPDVPRIIDYLIHILFACGFRIPQQPANEWSLATKALELSPMERPK